MAEEEALTEEDLKVTPEEDEISDDESTGEEDDKSGTPSDDDSKPGTAVDLEAKLAELEASNKGLVKSLTAQRGLRQDLQGQLDEIKTALQNVKSGQQETTITNSDGEVIPIDFDDKGNPFLDPIYLKDITNPEVAELKAKLTRLETQANVVSQQTSENQLLQNLLGEQDGYVEAHKQVTSAWKYLKDDIFDAYLVEKGLEAPKNADQAIEIAMNAPEIQAQFTKKFPTLDMESVLEAHLIATPRYLRKALNKALVDDGSSSHSALDITKPTSLANANSSGGDSQESLLARVGNMTTEDFMKLDEPTMAKIDKLLETHG